MVFILGRCLSNGTTKEPISSQAILRSLDKDWFFQFL